jgi:predicted transcriptional regulator
MNQTKIAVLGCLADGHWWTTRDVAQACNLSVTDVSESLRRYRGQSLVRRQRNWDVPKGYFYQISRVGLERLEYLTSDVVKTGSVLATRAGLSGSRKRVLNRWIEKKLGGR